MKMFSSRKVDRNGNSADAVENALFISVLALRFRRRGETQVDYVRCLFEVLKRVNGEDATNSSIVTADRGYEKRTFMNFLTGFGFGSVFAMPDHILRVHPFFAASYLNPT